MTGPVKGIATRIEREARHKIYRVWCSLHQLDLVMKYAYKDLQCSDAEFNKIMHVLTGYLRLANIFRLLTSVIVLPIMYTSPLNNSPPFLYWNYYKNLLVSHN